MIETDIDIPVLEVRNLSVQFALNRQRKLRAVSDLSFIIRRGETLGLVGESGCGKSSVARAIIQLPPPTAGKVFLAGEDLTRLEKRTLRKLRSRFQIIFQDSISSLNPRRTIGATIAMGLVDKAHKKPSEKKQLVTEMMSLVGIDPALYDRKPYEISGGQCQRVQLARAIIANPDLLILDEPVSSLDVSVQAQILNLLENLRAYYGLTMLFISHDLAVVKNVSDRVAVMYLGGLCEIGDSEQLYRSPLHPYTRALLDAIPEPDPFKRNVGTALISEEMLSLTDDIQGCRFKNRCPYAFDRCEKEAPKLKEVTSSQQAACHLIDNQNQKDLAE